MQTKAHLLHWVRHWLALGQRVLQKKKKKAFWWIPLAIWEICLVLVWLRSLICTREYVGDWKRSLGSCLAKVKDVNSLPFCCSQQ